MRHEAGKLKLERRKKEEQVSKRNVLGHTHHTYHVSLDTKQIFFLVIIKIQCITPQHSHWFALALQLVQDPCSSLQCSFGFLHVPKLLLQRAGFFGPDVHFDNFQRGKIPPVNQTLLLGFAFYLACLEVSIIFAAEKPTYFSLFEILSRGWMMNYSLGLRWNSRQMSATTSVIGLMNQTLMPFVADFKLNFHHRSTNFASFASLYDKIEVKCNSASI